MKQSTIDKVVIFILMLIGVLTLGLVVMIGWGFIELIQWLTSK